MSDIATVVETYILKNDFGGALFWLEDCLKNKKGDIPSTLQWIGYIASVLRNWPRAIEAYTVLLDSYGSTSASKETHLCLAICYFGQKKYAEASAAADKATSTPLLNRLQINIGQQLDDENLLEKYHKHLSSEVLEDQLCLAALHFERGHFQEAVDIYKKIMIANGDCPALAVYVAMCYNKLDYYDVSLEILQQYLTDHPNSPIAVNLAASNNYSLYDGKNASKCLDGLSNSSIGEVKDAMTRHNRVVFSDGENALKVLPDLKDSVPEALLNLAIYHLKHKDAHRAQEQVKALEPKFPKEYIVKAVVSATLGQANNNQEQLRIAQQLYQLVGSSASECDTIPGRQCMASVFFLLKQFEDANVYLNSVQAYCMDDDSFNCNYGVSLASLGDYQKALECLLRVKSEDHTMEQTYVSWLCKCYIMAGNPRKAWESCQAFRDHAGSNVVLLELIANSCYEKGYMDYANVAFAALYKQTPKEHYFQGLQCSTLAIFRMTMGGKASAKQLDDAAYLLLSCTKDEEKPLHIIRVITTWCEVNKVQLAHEYPKEKLTSCAQS